MAALFVCLAVRLVEPIGTSLTHHELRIFRLAIAIQMRVFHRLTARYVQDQGNA